MKQTFKYFHKYRSINNCEYNYYLKLIRSIFLMLSSTLVLISCSSVQESETKSSDSTNTASTYVFDNVTLVDSINNSEVEIVESPVIVEKAVELFIVQIGAFTTQEKAELFLLKFKNKINYDLNINFNTEKGLHVIQLPPFRTKEEADKVRDELRNINELEGTFTVPNYK
ncbi:MAG: SPOR domain-containing protein [Bacteroidetes bacterium]|nr:SPOR domain-containing protein [Bacteroidota bacterium]